MGHVHIAGEGGEEIRRVVDRCRTFDPSIGRFGPELPFDGHLMIYSGNGRYHRRMDYFPPTPPKAPPHARARDWTIVAVLIILTLDKLI